MIEKKFTLAGAGLVGSLFAIYLAKKGHRVDVFERRKDMRIETIGVAKSINLALSNRGWKALAAGGKKPCTVPAVCRLPSAVCRLASAVCRLPSAVCRLSSVGCHLPSAVCRLPSAACRLPPAACLLSPAVCHPPSALFPDLSFRFE